MNNNKKLGIFIIVVGLLLIAAIIYFIFMPNRTATIETPPVDNNPLVQLPAVIETSSTTPGDRPRYKEYDLSQEAEHKTNGDDLAKLASAFAERLGSYSNQSNYSNFEDLNIFMTASMRDWAKNYVENTRRDNPYNGTYYGVTTKAVSTEVVDFNDAQSSAEVVVSTQRRETTLDGGENNYQQNLRLTFIKEADQWLVDGAYWLK
ncbi:MAG: hypothetical protein PHE20_00410 [Patescibacteria group bacterium]|nr:hypothetical protein [Patescibacteria group bacterium]